MTTEFKELGQDHIVPFEWNGKTVDAHITVRVFYDPCYDDSLDDESTKAKIANGAYTPAVVEVKAWFAGLCGADSIGGCLLTDDKAVDWIVKDHDMLAEAVASLKRVCANTLKQLTA